MWAIGRYDLGLSDDEFEECTPKMFQALCKRRNVRIKYDRFANAMTAAAIYNVNRSSENDPMVRAFDFVMTDEQAKQREQRISFTRFIKKTIGGLPLHITPEGLRKKRLNVIADLRASGCTNPEEMFDEIWPHLKPVIQEGN